MLTEFLLALIPAVGGIAYGVGNKLGHVAGRDEALRTARKEYDIRVRTEINMRDREDHLREVPGHICGEACFEAMKLQTKIQEWKNNPY